MPKPDRSYRNITHELGVVIWQRCFLTEGWLMVPKGI